MKTLRAVATVLLLVLAGCGEPTLDSKDLQESIADLRDSLDAEEQVRFDGAIAVVVEASRGEVTGTQRFALDGMTAAKVLAEAERIEVRRELALIAETVAAQQEVLQAEEQLARLRVVGFQPGSQGDRVTAAVTLVNTLGTPLDSGWLLIEVELPDGRLYSGPEFVAFRPPLAPREQRTLRLVLAGDEARALPAEPGAKLRHRFTSLERGGRTVAEAPSPQQRARAEAALAEAETRRSELEARLREL
jgi:hypothetical protein